MQSMCDEFLLCSLLPGEWQWLIALLMPLVVITLVAVPVANILHRAGRSRWWTVLAFVPLLNLVLLWVFAFSRWPAVDRDMVPPPAIRTAAASPA
jgi:hypothetical protein